MKEKLEALKQQYKTMREQSRTMKQYVKDIEDLEKLLNLSPIPVSVSVCSCSNPEPIEYPCYHNKQYCKNCEKEITN